MDVVSDGGFGDLVTFPFDLLTMILGDFFYSLTVHLTVCGDKNLRLHLGNSVAVLTNLFT